MKKILFLLFTTLFTSTYAQQIRTIDDAIGIALKNNFDIQIAKNSASVSKTNNTFGNAGMLPTVSANGTGSVQWNNSTINTIANGEMNFPNQTTHAWGANVELNWRLFDGGKMFVTKNKLAQIEAQGQIRFKSQVTKTVFDVTNAYFNVVAQKQQLKSIEEAINFNRERVKIEQIAFQNGLHSKSDLLQAKIDLNVFLENSILQKTNIEVALKNLRLLLAEEQETPFDVIDSIAYSKTLERKNLDEKLFTSNNDILDVQKQIEIAQLALKENIKSNYPLINFRTGYYYSQTENSAGQTLSNRSNGPQVGGSISIPVYTGGENQRRINVSKLDLQASKIRLEALKKEIQTQWQNTWTNFDNQKQLLEIEYVNNQLAKENLDISLQRLRLGQTNSLEVHLAQENLVQSSTRLINIQFNLKLAETHLKQLLADF